jgi:diadenylate cyclase
MQDPQQLSENLAYLGYLISGPQRLITLLDLLLVTITFFLILLFIRRSRAAMLVRGILVLALLMVAVIALLRLPTFNWLLRTALLVGLVATPIIFQPELRRGLERLGRTIGFLNVRPVEMAHRVVPTLARTVDSFASSRTGALIVLEGQTSLDEFASTGVPMQSELSADLLQTIFFDQTPLHDGAVILREDQILAAACVLPLSEQALPDGMFQGTRHRAALGVSEQADCLAIVVSEETGIVSVAHMGKMQRHLDTTQLRDYLFRFYDPAHNRTSGQRMGLWRRPASLSRRTRSNLPKRSRIMRSAGYAFTFLVAALLAVAAWMLIGDQVNPLQTTTITEVPLRPPKIDPGMVVVGPLPTTVAVTAQAPQDVLGSLLPTSFSAQIEASTTEPGVQRAAVVVRPGAGLAEVRVIGSDPAAVDLDIQPLATEIFTVTVVIPDRDSLPFSYEISGTATTEPSQVTVTGPAESVEQVALAEVSAALRGAKSTVQEDRTVVLKDGAGQVVTGLRVDPETVRVTVPIRQTFNTREAAVYPVITGNVASGYWISNVTVTPSTVILLGDPAELEKMGGLVDTAPIDVTGAAADIVRRVPLAPPSGVTALNERGVTEGSVEVRISVVAQTGNVRVTVPVDVAGSQEGATVSTSPASVDLYLSGALPALNQVVADPRLVRVVVDVSELATGVYTVTPRLIVPDELRATVFPETIEVRVDRRAVEQTPTPTPAAAPRAP